MKSSSWSTIAFLSLLFFYLMSAPTARFSAQENIRPQPSLQQRPDRRDDVDTERILRLNSLGVALMEQLKFEEAAVKFTEIILIDNGFAPGYVNLGIAYFNLQDYENSLQSLGQAIRIDPDQIYAHYVRGLIYRNQDKVEMAVGEFEVVRNQDPEDPSTNYYLGLLSSRQRNYDEAIVHLDQVIKREPYSASAHYNLAIAFLRSGRRAEGEKEMGEFRRLQGLFGSTTIGLQYLEQGKYAVAIDQIPTEYLPDLDQPSSVGAIRVTFTEVSVAARVQFWHAGPARTSLVIKSRKDLEDRLVPFLGSGIAFVDYNSDDWLDLFVANAGSTAATGALFKNLGKGTFSEITSEAGIGYSGKTMSALWGISIMMLLRTFISSTTGPTSSIRIIQMGHFRMLRKRQELRTLPGGSAALGLISITMEIWISSFPTSLIPMRWTIGKCAFRTIYLALTMSFIEITETVPFLMSLYPLD